MLFSKFFPATLTYALYNMIWTAPAVAENVTAAAYPAWAYTLNHKTNAYLRTRNMLWA